MSDNNETKVVPEVIKALDEVFVSLWKGLSPLVTREEFCMKQSIYSVGTMANFDSQGRGPSNRMKVGKKVCYSRTEAVVWLASKAKNL